MVKSSNLDSFMKELFTLENAVCVIIIALLLTMVVRKCRKEGFVAPYNPYTSSEAEEEEGE
jgi:hypothetical protein